MQCNSYEKRIRDLEQTLAEQQMQLQKYTSIERHDRGHRRSHDSEEFDQVQERTDQGQDSSETSGITGDGVGRVQRGVGIPEPMDEGMVSNMQANSTASIDTRTDSGGGRREGTREGGDEVMSDVSGTVTFVSLHLLVSLIL